MPRRSKRRSRRRHPRAVAVAVAGLLALIAAGGFGTPALQPIGIGLLLTGIGAIATVEVAAGALRLNRTVDRDILGADERVGVVTALNGWPARHGFLRLLDWDLRAGTPAGAATEVRRPRRTRTGVAQDSVIHGLSRGIHTLGAPSVGLSDPFGLARVRRASTTTTDVLVLPATVPVLIPFWESGAARRAGQAAGVLRGRAELGGVRDYEPGDPLSLIHWAQTARRGSLQTKELFGESGRGATLLVLLDASADPATAGVPDGPFEVAVAAAASIVACCGARGDLVGLEHTAAGADAFPVGSSVEAMERELATVQASGAQRASLAIRAVCGRPSAPRQLLIVTATADRGLGSAAQHARSCGMSAAAVLVGPARALAQDLRRAGVWVTEVAGRDDLRAALDGGGRSVVAS